MNLHVHRLPISRLAGAAALLLAVLGLGQPLGAQILPKEISANQATELPYRESGKLTVQFGANRFFGTATYIRRYTGLTAGHLLYDPSTGFAASVVFEPGFYLTATTTQPVGFFAVLSGYQGAAGVDQNSDNAFARDMGYFILRHPSPLDEWAVWTDDPSDLADGSSFLALGYAAESFPGDQLAYVQTSADYVADVGAEYQNTSFYTEQGMSGGPVYATVNGSTTIAGINVAGSSRPDPAESAARAITPDERPLFIDAEYTQGCISGGTLTGPSVVAAGSSALFKTGVVFKDGRREGTDFRRTYDELIIKPMGAVKQLITIEKVKISKFRLTFDPSLTSGTQVTLRLFRNTDPIRSQTPLQTLTVTIQ